MVYPPLHGALGLPPSPLEYSMIQAAVDQHVTERIDIDWKSTLPDKQKPKEPEEFAKDISDGQCRRRGHCLWRHRGQG